VGSEGSVRADRLARTILHITSRAFVLPSLRDLGCWGVGNPGLRLRLALGYNSCAPLGLGMVGRSDEATKPRSDPSGPDRLRDGGEEKYGGGRMKDEWRKGQKRRVLQR